MDPKLGLQAKKEKQEAKIETAEITFLRKNQIVY
jgi:hypothetical protein